MNKFKIAIEDIIEYYNGGTDDLRPDTLDILNELYEERLQLEIENEVLNKVVFDSNDMKYTNLTKVQYALEYIYDHCKENGYDISDEEKVEEMFNVVRKYIGGEI